MKQSAKPVKMGRKRKRHGVFDPANDAMNVDAEAAKQADKDKSGADGFKDVTDKLKKPKQEKS